MENHRLVAAKFISLAEMNEVLKYIKSNKSVYLRKKIDDEYFPSSRCWINVEARNMTVLYRDDTGKVKNYAFDLAEGNTHNKRNPGTTLSTLGKYYKIPEIKDLYPDIAYLCQPSDCFDEKGRSGMKVEPLLMFNQKFEGKRTYAYCYDMNSAYSWAMLQDMPDTSHGLRVDDIVEENEIGFFDLRTENINGDVTTSYILSEPGDYAHFIFPRMKSPFGRFVRKWYDKKVNAQNEEEKLGAKEMLNYCIGCLQNHNPFIRCAIVNYCNNRIIDIIAKERKKGNDFLYANTDCVTLTKPIDYLTIGNDVGEWKIKEGYFAFRGCNYQWDLEIPTYRGIPKKWFPEGWDILKCPLPKSNNNYIFDATRMEIVENEIN